MLGRLATFQYANGRRMLFAAIVGAAIAGAFGFGVAKHLSPYGANDPATQSVQATHRFESAAGRQLEPGVVALVSPVTRDRLTQVATTLRSSRDVASVSPGPVSRDG